MRDTAQMSQLLLAGIVVILIATQLQVILDSVCI